MSIAAVALAAALLASSGDAGASPLAAAATRVAAAALATVLPVGRPASIAQRAMDPPPGSGPEFTRYVSPPEIGNRFLVGGLLAWTGVLVGGLMLLEKRRLAALAIGGGGLAVGLALMLSGMI